MDRVTELADVVNREVASYADGPLIKGIISALANPDEGVYAVVVAPDDTRLFQPNRVRVVGEHVVGTTARQRTRSKHARLRVRSSSVTRTARCGARR